MVSNETHIIKPVLLIDADEVILHFVQRLEEFLNDQAYDLRLTTYQLTGNIFHQPTEEEASAETVRQLIGDFFEYHVDDIQPVDGAIETISGLQSHFDISILTNVPMHLQTRRQNHLADLGINAPVIANRGGKGEMVKQLMNTTTAPFVFIDDLPPQLAAVGKHAPDCHRIHFVADPRLKAMQIQTKHAHAHLDSWNEIEDYLLRLSTGFQIND